MAFLREKRSRLSPFPAARSLSLNSLASMLAKVSFEHEGRRERVLLTISFFPTAMESEVFFTILVTYFFLHDHREASALSNEIPEESEQFRFLRTACNASIKGSVGLILAKASAMRISIPLDLSSRPFIPLPRFMLQDELHHS